MRFVKEVHKAGLFVHLRIGPYACAEWNYGLVLRHSYQRYVLKAITICLLAS